MCVCMCVCVCMCIFSDVINLKQFDMDRVTADSERFQGLGLRFRFRGYGLVSRGYLKNGQSSQCRFRKGSGFRFKV